ncbi:MAG: efflux RND transporter permease subunit, partial [Pirellulaceae bacterium]
MILIFLRDWRSSLIVLLNIPLALFAAILALWLTGQTINLMTLGGLALAIGILVDEAIVSIENIHSQIRQGKPIAQAVRDGSMETAIPRLLAMLCILAVFVSSFFMQGAARGLFVPLSLAVGFAMIASYFLSSTLVPVMAVWFLKSDPHSMHQAQWMDRLRRAYERLLGWMIPFRWLLIPVYLGSCIGLCLWHAPHLGRDIFPVVDAGQFRLRMRAKDGTHIAKTEALAKEALAAVASELGSENIAVSLGYVGMIHSNFPVNAVYQWSRGPEETILYIDLKQGLDLPDEVIKERLRQRLAKEMPDVRFSFEPSDIVNEVMSFGSA